MTRVFRAVAALLLLAVIAGCVRLDGDVTLAPDETVSGTVVIAVHQDWALGNGQDPAALQNIILEEVALTPEGGVSAEPYEDADYIGATLILDGVDFDRVEESTNGALTVTALDGGYQVAGRFEDLDATAPDPRGEEQIDTPWQIALSVTFPEAVREHDGSLTGRTVSWDLQPGQNELFASTTDGGFSLPVPLPVLLFGALVLAGAVLILVLRRRRKSP